MYVNKHMHITVPKNQIGYEEYDYGIEHTENMEEWLLSHEEYLKLIQSGVIRALETEFEDVYIDVSESSVITADQLRMVYDEINIVPGVFLTAVDKVIQYNTCICLDF